MAASLYHSTICRLCGEVNPGGTLLFITVQNDKCLADTINDYLPVKVHNDGKLPQTICPGCTIQIEATVEFFDLIVKGQQSLRELYKKQQGLLREQSDPLASPDVDVNYPEDHPMALKAAGLVRPKRKRGRPPKKVKSPEEVEMEILETEKERSKKKENEEPSGKRRRKTPTRFKEVVQGEELERILIQEGVATGDSDGEAPPAPRAPAAPEVIGHMAASGELVLMAKGKGRGRPKGSLKQQSSECPICGEWFSCSGRYMRHVAAHGPVRFQCAACLHTCGNRLELERHHKEYGHEGRRVIKEEGQEQQKAAEENSEPEVVADAVVEYTEDPIKTETTDVKIEMSNTKLETVQITEEVAGADNVQNVEEKQAEEEETASPNKKKLKCNYCDKVFSSRQSKSMHTKASHKGERPYSCAECGASFAYPRSLALHALAHKKRHGLGKGYACDLCGKVLNHPSSVIYHKQSEHAGQRYVCNKCNKTFRHKQLLQRHQLVHSADRPWPCKHCSASFKTRANLLNHSVLHSGSKRHVCAICKQRFSHKTSLTLHMRWHQGIKPFTCNFCGKSFTQKGNLSEHIRIHTGERPYHCTKCPKTFTTSSQRRLHLKRHDNLKNKLQISSKPSCSCTDMKLCPHIKLQSSVNKVLKQLSRQSTKSNKLSLLMSPELPEDQHVIYVTYDVDSQSDHTYEILGDAEVNEQLQSPKLPSLFPGPSLLVPPLPPADYRLQLADNTLDSRILQEEEVETVEIEEPSMDGEEMRIPVTDEAGNPLHFTMADGTRLAITSSDGHSLQVVTHDGQTIPVEINNYINEEDTNDEQTIVHHLDLQKTIESDDSQLNESPVTHYFTIV